MTEEMRQVMGKAAVDAAKAINYSGAGTVEFIVDSSEGLLPDRFWFMEMNTRLQVEHPVTEAIANCDLVEWQLRVAAGEVLPVAQSDLAIDGWAMEARIYAEDVEKGFLPATGTLHYLQFPENVRIDTGVCAGDTISPYYDPMIAKLTVKAATREEARRKLLKALGNTHASGSITNINFLSDLISIQEFADGNVDTGLIDRYNEQLTAVAVLSDEVACIAAMHAAGLNFETRPFSSFALWQPLLHTVLLKDRYGDEISVSLESIDGSEWNVNVDGRSHSLTIQADDKYFFDGSALGAVCRSHQEGISVFTDRAWHLTVPDPLEGDGDSADGGDVVLAPMPGQVKLVQVAAGDVVAAGDALMVMEAMKMEHTLTAPRDGTVEEVLGRAGDQVEDGAILLKLVDEA